MTLTKYYLNKMGNRLIQDVKFMEKEKLISKERADWLVGNIQAEVLWAKKKLIEVSQ